MGEQQGKTVMKAILVVVAVITLILISSLVVQSIADTTILIDSTLSGTTLNETGAFINSTTYTVAEGGRNDFSALTITGLSNSTDNSTIAIANVTVSGSGFTNATALNWDDVTVSYTYTYTDGTNLAGINITALKNNFGDFVTSLLGFLSVIGVIVAVVWLLFYIRPLFSKKDGIQTFAGN